MKHNYRIYLGAAFPCQIQFESLGTTVNDYRVNIKMSYGGLTLERQVYIKEEARDPGRDLFIEAVYEMRNNLLKGVTV